MFIVVEFSRLAGSLWPASVEVNEYEVFRIERAQSVILSHSAVNRHSIDDTEHPNWMMLI